MNGSNQGQIYTKGFLSNKCLSDIASLFGILSYLCCRVLNNDDILHQFSSPSSSNKLVG